VLDVRAGVFELELAVGDGKPSSYSVERSVGLLVKVDETGASYLVRPQLSSKDEALIEISLKRVYSFLQWEFLVDSASVTMREGKAAGKPVKMGPFSIWAARYKRPER
jgi:hypothetical protein